METITDRNRIQRLLNTIKDVRALLQVTLPNNGDSQYTSAILEVDDETHELLLDELLPNDSGSMVLTGQSLSITANLYGVAIEFHTQVERTGKIDGISYYSAPLPETLTYAQQRADYRVHISMLNRPSVLLDAPDLGPTTGEVLNISLGGACLLLDKSTPLEPGHRISLCHISLPDGAHIECPADVCHVRMESGLNKQTSDKKQVGIAFHDIPIEQRRAQQAYIIKLQRELAKTKSLDND